jgi:phosphatidylethanolamine-binding protein (PEBP) family uncharacterized protein
VFTVYALSAEKLGVTPDAAPTEVAASLRAHALAKATLTARYGR